jgi:hypothetical protein
VWTPGTDAPLAPPACRRAARATLPARLRSGAARHAARLSWRFSRVRTSLAFRPVNVRWHAWIMVASIAMLVGAGACASSASTPSASRTPSPTPLTLPSTGTLSPSPGDAPEYPNLSRFADPLDRFAYKSAYSDCRLIGVDGTADAFGGDPGDPSSVARAYARSILPSSEEHRGATFRGCLDGFEAEASS